MRLVMAQPYEKVLAGFVMSSITGPNEGAVMVQRAIFGLLQWEAPPADARRRTIGDLTGAARANAIGDGAMAVAKNIRRAKSGRPARSLPAFCGQTEFRPPSSPTWVCRSIPAAATPNML
jgi:hypothetical protein